MSFQIEIVVEIDAPAALVWEVISDLPRYAEWNPFCIECRSTLKPGDPIDMRVKLLARPQSQREWVTEFVPGKRFAYRMKPVPLGLLSSLRTHEITPIDAQRTRYRSYFELRGWLQPLVVGLLGARLREGFSAMTGAVQRRSEQLARQRRAA